MRRQIVGIFALKYRSNENLFLTRYGSSGDYHFASDFVLGRCRWRHSYGHGWQQLPLLHAFIGDDSPRRHSKVDLELDRSQQHLGYSGSPQWDLGFGNPFPGSHVHSHLQYCGVISVLLHSTWGMLRYGRHSRRHVECDAATDADANANPPSSSAWRRYGYSS